MKEVSHLLRKAYLDALSPFIIEGVTIPIFDEMVNPSVSIPLYRGASAYILVTDQSESETTNNDSSFRQNANISFDIVCKSQSLSGKLATELISNQLQEEIHKLAGVDITIAGFQILDKP